MKSAIALLFALAFVATGIAQEPEGGTEEKLVFPPKLPDAKEVVADTAPEFLRPPATFPREVAIAQTPPTIDFLYYPGQDYPGKPWSVWGDGSVVDRKYYSAIGDHLAPAGNAFVFEYDAAARTLRRLLDVRSLLALPEGHYVPGKIHSRIEQGSDGWLYFSTHRGSTKVTTDEFHFRGDWVLRHHPIEGRSEIVAHAPVPKHCLPTSVLDPDRLIFYGGTTPGVGKDEGGNIHFFAYDVRAKRLVYSGPNGPSRSIALASSSGRVYFTPAKEAGSLMRFDPSKGEPPQPLDATLNMRAATGETPQGVIYLASSGQQNAQAELFALNTRTELVEPLGPAAVGKEDYIATIDADPTGRFLYYIPGAHGSAERDGSPVVQFDVQTRRKKVIAFLHPFYAERYGCALRGTYSSALSPAGDVLYVTWNASRTGGRNWDCCALTVIHIPSSER
jgi:hypothetical protein